MGVQRLQGLGKQALEEIAACQKLDTYFAEGAVQIRREDHAKRLRKMVAMIKLDVEKAESSEKREQTAAQELESGVEIAKLFINPLMNNRDAFEKTMVTRKASRQHCFGNIMVCISKGGFPDDVHVISIAEKAREQNKPESAIILELQRSGFLLVSPNNFQQLVVGVVRDVRNGKLKLPVLPKHLISILLGQDPDLKALL